MQAAAAKINLIPAKVAQLRGAEAAAVCNQDHCRVAVPWQDRLRAVSSRRSISFSVKTIIKPHIAPMAVFIQLGVDPSVAMVFIRLRYELSELSKLSKLACVPTRPKSLKTLAWL